MGLLKMLGKLAVAAVAGVVLLTIVGKVRQAQEKAAPPASASAAGFVMLKPADAGSNKVLILAPANCPRDNAKRARAMGAALASAGIPHEMSDNISFVPANEQEAERFKNFMDKGEVPLVFIRGRGKSNPTLDEVIAEYRSAPRK
ncbi:MAG: hypothetical protein ABUL68_05330 [Pseudomonadota bacterium]